MNLKLIEFCEKRQAIALGRNDWRAYAFWFYMADRALGVPDFDEAIRKINEAYTPKH